MSKKLLFIGSLIFLVLASGPLYAQDTQPATPEAKAAAVSQYEAGFTYTALWKKGNGSSGEGVTPIVTLSEEAPQVVKITLPPFVFSDSYTIMAFEIPGVKLIPEDNVTKIHADKFTTSDGKYKITGYSLEGTIKQDKIEFEVVYRAGSMPFKMHVIYNGKLLKK